jgi:hypothetical protein
MIHNLTSISYVGATLNPGVLMITGIKRRYFFDFTFNIEYLSIYETFFKISIAYNAILETY